MEIGLCSKYSQNYISIPDMLFYRLNPRFTHKKSKDLHLVLPFGIKREAPVIWGSIFFICSTRNSATNRLGLCFDCKWFVSTMENCTSFLRIRQVSLHLNVCNVLGQPAMEFLETSSFSDKQVTVVFISLVVCFYTSLEQLRHYGHIMGIKGTTFVIGPT